MGAHRLRPSTRAGVALASSAAVLTALTACAGAESSSEGGEYGFPSVEQDPAAPITVWVDASREPIANAFKDAHPDIDVSIETYDGNAGGSDSFRTKIALFDQSGEGWPDVVFSTQTNDASWAATDLNGNQAYAAALNKGLMDEEWLDGFTEGALDAVTVDGTVYGVRNDLAPVVLWYDQALLDEFGYELPTTWEEYEALGETLAAEHPGYILGSIGDSFVGTYVYYWGAKAPIFQFDGTTFHSDFSDDYSVRMTTMLDTMLDNGSLVTDSVFSATFIEDYAGKIVAMPGPVWYSGALFQNPDGLNAPAGTIGAAAPLHWDGDDEVTGNVGGGVWYGSSHSQNLDAVKTFLEFVASSDQAAELASGLPAYASAADTWLEAQASSGFYTGDFVASVNTAANSVWDGWGFPSFSPETAYADIVVPEISSGGHIADVTEAWEEKVKNEAQVQGHDVD